MPSRIELYEFKAGDDAYRYVRGGEDVLWNGHIYHSTELSRDSIKQSPDIASNGIKVSFPLNHPFAVMFRGYGPDHITVLTIFVSDGQGGFGTAFKGRITDCEADRDSITLVAEMFFTRLKNAGGRARMQRFCRHVLYHRGCGVIMEDFAVPATVTAIDSRYSRVTCPEAAVFPNQYFAGGMMRLPSGALRYVVAHQGDQVDLWRPEPDLADMIENSGWGMSWGMYWGGSGVVLYPGCDGSKNTCHDRFDNIPNNGAFYWIPRINPHGGSNIF